MKRLARLLPVALLAAGCAAAPHPITVPVDGGSLFIDDGGRSGIPIVFVHGNGGSSEQWKAQLEHLRAGGRRAIAVDLPGFGRSTGTTNGDLSLDAAAAAIDHAVEAIHVDRFVIVGHSYGGAVVATYAAAHPKKVAGIVYLDAVATALPLSKEQGDQLATALRANKMAVVRGWFAPMLKPSSENVQQAVFKSVENTSADVFIAALMSLKTYDARRLVNAYTGPKLAIAATDIESSASFQKLFPEVQVVKIPGAGHWLMLDKPEDVNVALDGFLTTIQQ
jgi:pimeloyl-ACP methyl ester carboxylesterase